MKINFVLIVGVAFFIGVIQGCGNNAGRDNYDRYDRDERDERSHYVTRRRYNDRLRERRYEEDYEEDDDYDRGYPRGYDRGYEREYRRVYGRDYDYGELRDVLFSANKTKSDDVDYTTPLVWVNDRKFRAWVRRMREKRLERKRERRQRKEERERWERERESRKDYS